MRRATVGCAMPRLLEAASVEPARMTARKTRTSDQFSKRFFIFLEQHNVAADTRSVSLCRRVVSTDTLSKDPKHMALIEITTRRAAFSLRQFCAGVAQIFGQPDQISDPTDTARRDFVIDSLRNNDAAFRSEADVQCMMSVYPGRF
jgi:hypothetical protein